MAILNHGSTLRTADGGQTTTTIVTAANIGTYGVATNSTYYVGTTQNIFNRASGAQTLTGVSIDGNAATVTNGVYTTGAQTIGGTKTFSDVLTFNANVDMGTSTGSKLPGHFYTNTYDGTNVYFHIGTSNSTNKILNLRVFDSANNYATYIFNSAGTVSAPGDFRAPIFYDSANTAYYLDPANTGTSLLVAGSVGISKTSLRSGSVLDVNGFGCFGASAYGFYIGTDATGAFLDAGSQLIRMFAGSSEKLRIQADGNVGIGTTTPSQKLDVSGAINASTYVYAGVFYDNDNTVYYTNPSGTSNLVGLTVANTITGSVSGNAATAGGLAVHTGTNNEANKIVRTDVNGYIQAGWINTTSGDQGTSAIDRVYASYDGYIRYYSPTNFRTVLDVPTRGGSGASGNWAINATNITAYTINQSVGTANSPTFVGLTLSPSAASQFQLNSPSGTQGLWIRAGYDSDGTATPSASALNVVFQASGNSSGTFSFVSGNTKVVSISGSALNSLVAIQQSGNQVLNTSNYVGYSAFTSSLTSTVDARAPIFYDSNDTAYYLDAANTTLSLKTRSSIVINNASAPNNLAMLNIGYNGGGETRAIDIQGGWSSGENKSITFTHGSGSTNIVAQINAQHNGPGSKLRWGKLHHSGDSSAYTMELVSESTTSAYLTVVGSVRAPIFYDSNNTTYYVDPASTGYSAYFAGAIQATKIGIEDAGLDCYMEITDANPTVYGVGYGGEFIFYGDKSTPASFLYYGGATVTYTLQANSSLRSPIFYDSNDTAYYIDPASTSNLNIVTVNDVLTYGVIAAKSFSVSVNTSTYWTIVRPNGSSIATGYVYRITLCTTGTGTDTGEQYLLANVDSAGWVIKTVTKTGSGSNWPYVFLDSGVPKVKTDHASLYTVTVLIEELNSGNTGGLPSVFGLAGLFTSDNGTPKYRAGLFSSDNTLLHSGNYSGYSAFTSSLTSTVDARAPIFYDSNDTNYYVDPASTSILNGTRHNTVVAGSTSAMTSAGQLAIYSSASPYISFHDGGVGRTAYMQETGGRFYFGEVTYTESEGSFRAPLFYDSNDTAYYVNPNSTSNLYDLTVANNLTVNGNTYLGNAGGDTVFVNDIIRIGATDSGDASLFFGEGSVAGSDYGARWYWDSGYTFTWYTRNAGTDTSLFDYVTNDTTYLNWRRNFHMQNKSIDYTGQIHFNAGTRFVGSSTNYLIFRSDATNAGGFIVQDGNGTLKGYVGYWDAGGGGILNNTGNWAVRYNFGSSSSGGTLYGSWISDADFRAPIFYDSNDTAYYGDFASTSVLNRLNYQQLRRNFASTVYTGTAGSRTVKTFSGVLVGGSAIGGNSAYTVIETTIPQGAYQMGGFTIKWFENYSSTNAKTSIEIAGYWNPVSNGGFQGFEYTTSNPNVQPTIRVGANASGNTVFILDHFSSAYTVIIARDLWLGYDNADGEWGTGWTMVNTTTIAAYSNIVSAVLRVGPTLTGTGASGSWGISVTGSSASCTGNAATATNGLTTSNYVSYSAFTASLTSTVDARAPIFYDSNNTAYYIDGASGSKLKYLQIDGDWASSPFGSGHESFTIRSTYASMVQRQTNGALAYWLHHIAGDGAYNLYGGRGATDGSSWDWAYRAYPNQDGNYVEFNTSARAQIFYDRNDTAYYLDPRSASVLSGLKLNGIDNDAAGNTSDAILWINKPNNNDWGIRVTGNLEYLLKLEGATSHSYNIQGMANGSEFWRCGTDLLYHNSNIRAPIFYDSANTAYYINPDGVSNLVGLTVVNQITGSISGNAGGSSASCTGNAASASYANEIIITNLGTATVSINNGRTAIYRNENGLGAALAYSPVLHAGAGDTMWQVQGTYGSSGNGTFYFRQGYQGVFGNWLTMLSSANYNSYSPTLTGTGASGSWGISVTGSSASCTGNSATTTLATKATRANGNFYIDDNYGNTVVGVYSATRLQGVFAMGDSYKLTADGTGVGTLYGLAWSHPNFGGVAANLADHGLLILQNGVFKGAWGGGSLRTPGDVRGTLFYDWDNTGYYCDPASTSNLYAITAASNITAAQYYTGGWFRNNASGNGLYNEATGQHFYSDSANYWNVASSASAQGIRLRTGGHAGTVRGYFYADTNNDVGFLNQDGNWRLRVVGGDYSLADGSSMRAQLFYDSNNTGYYVDPASTSNLAGLTVANTITGSITGSAGSVAWTNVSGRPTAVSSFSNDSGYITSGGSISGSSGSCTGNAASVTDGVYLSTNQSISGVKTFSSPPVATNIAKAWVHYNMNNNTINASYNVSSVTDNGTGVCTVNFSTSMVDANYVVAGTATYGYDDQDIYAMILAVPRRSTAQQAGSCRLATEFIHAAQVYDCVAVRAVFYR